MIDVNRAKEYIRVDEDDLEISMLIKTSYMYLEGATGTDYSKIENEKADIFILALVDELYNDRGLTTEKGANNMKYIYKSILLQLQLESESYV